MWTSKKLLSEITEEKESRLLLQPASVSPFISTMSQENSDRPTPFRPTNPQMIGLTPITHNQKVECYKCGRPSNDPTFGQGMTIKLYYAPIPQYLCEPCVNANKR